MDDIANSFLNEIVRTVPVDSGDLKLSLDVEAVGNKLIIRMLEYGEAVEFGVKPWMMKNGKMHSGQRMNPFIRTAIFTKLNTYIKEALERYG